jgi:hypothetical protein
VGHRDIWDSHERGEAALVAGNEHRLSAFQERRQDDVPVHRFTLHLYILGQAPLIMQQEVIRLEPMKNRHG